MFDLSAPIIPGKSAAGIELGQAIDEVIKFNQPNEITIHGDSTKYNFNQVVFWANNGRVFQIGVKLGYQGSIQGKVGVGTTIHDVQLTFGEVSEDGEDNFIVSNFLGWCFETEVWQNGQEISKNLNSRITEIFVFVENKKV